MPTLAELAITTGIVAGLGIVGHQLFTKCFTENKKDPVQQQVAQEMKGVNISPQPAKDAFAKT